MTATIIAPDFPGNRPRITRDVEEPCVVIILPVVRVDAGRKLRHLRVPRKLPKEIA